MKLFTTLVVFVLLSVVLFAHSGHGAAEHQTGFWHFIVNPIHFLPIIAVLGFVIYLVSKKFSLKKVEENK